LLCDGASVLLGLFPCRKASDGPINQSNNFPLLRLRRDSEQDKGCGTLPGIVGFSETIFSAIDPNHFT